MNKFQRLSFRSVDDFMDHIDGKEKQMTEVLRGIILAALPDVREHLSYNVPFYSRRKRICYIWPSAIPWGGLTPGDGVALGFCQGHRIRHGGYLETGNRKYVAQRIFRNPGDIDEWLIADLLAEAQAVDLDS